MKEGAEQCQVRNRVWNPTPCTSQPVGLQAPTHRCSPGWSRGSRTRRLIGWETMVESRFSQHGWVEQELCIRLTPGSKRRRRSSPRVLRGGKRAAQENRFWHCASRDGFRVYRLVPTQSLSRTSDMSSRQSRRCERHLFWHLSLPANYGELFRGATSTITVRWTSSWPCGTRDC